MAIRLLRNCDNRLYKVQGKLPLRLHSLLEILVLQEAGCFAIVWRPSRAVGKMAAKASDPDIGIVAGPDARNVLVFHACWLFDRLRHFAKRYVTRDPILTALRTFDEVAAATSPPLPISSALTKRTYNCSLWGPSMTSRLPQHCYFGVGAMGSLFGVASVGADWPIAPTPNVTLIGNWANN